MNLSGIFAVSAAVIGSVGGAALIIVGLSSWLGKVWANRILEQDRFRYQSEIEKLKNELASEREKGNFVFSMYFEGQFKIYNNLWVSLVELRRWVDQLWAEATNRNLRNFIRALEKAKRQIQNSALLIEPDHYNQITNAMQAFADYKVGKEGLVSIRSTQRIDDSEVQDIIDGNQHNRQLIVQFTDDILAKMRGQLRDAGALLTSG